MKHSSGKLTVFFEDPFWVGVFERREKGYLEISKIVFGPCPRNEEIYELILSEYSTLSFQKVRSEEIVVEKNTNPKRRQREAKKQVENKGVSTKSQEAMKLLQAQGKAARKKESRLQKLQKQRELFEKKRQRKKEKHRGR